VKLVSLLLTLMFKTFFRKHVLPAGVFRLNAQCLFILRYLLFTVEPWKYLEKLMWGKR